MFNIEAKTSEATALCSVLFSLSINKSGPDIANSFSFEAFRKLGNFGQCGDRKLLNRTGGDSSKSEERIHFLKVCKIGAKPNKPPQHSNSCITIPMTTRMDNIQDDRLCGNATIPTS